MYGGFMMMEVIQRINVQIMKRSFFILYAFLFHFIGLTILLPYIISTRSNWEHCKMRIFALANHKQDIEAQEKE